MPDKLYTGESEPLMVLFDFRDPVQRRAFDAHRAAFKGRTRVEAVYGLFYCLYILPNVGRLQS
jgi:hypothetical protein